MALFGSRTNGMRDGSGWPFPYPAAPRDGPDAATLGGSNDGPGVTRPFLPYDVSALASDGEAPPPLAHDLSAINFPSSNPSRSAEQRLEEAALHSQQCILALANAHRDQQAVRRADALMPILRPAATVHGDDPRLLAAIAVRETGARNIAERGGGAGQGIFQLTNQPGVTAAQANSIPFAADYAAKMLAQNRRFLARRFPNFTPAQLLQATAASYNFGPGGVHGNPATIDVGTTGNDYGSTVVGLMNCFPPQ